MTASSVARGVAEQKKEAKRNAIEKGEKPEGGKLEHKEVEVGRVQAKTSRSDSPKQSGKVKAPSKKPTVKKASAKKSTRRSSKSV